MEKPLRTALTELTDTSCCVCGILFSVPRSWMNQRRNTGGDLYCPNGHSLHYTETTVDKLERELKDERTKRWKIEMELGQERVKRERIEKRISKGVCPYCKRTFRDVARHMKCKHEKSI